MAARKTTTELRAEIAKLKKKIKRLEAELKAKFNREYWKEYVEDSGFTRYSKAPRSLTIPLVAKLK